MTATLPRLAASPARRPLELPTVELHVPELTVAIDTSAADRCTWGRTAGSEGLGSELFADEQGCVVGLDLELRPLRVLQIIEDREIAELKRRVGTAAASGELRIVEFTSEPIVARSIWLAADLSTVAAVFSGDAASWPERERAVGIADGVAVLLDASTGTLAGVVVDEPARRQRIYGATVDFGTFDAPARALAASLYVSYARPASRPSYDRSAAAALAELEAHVDAAAIDALRRSAEYLSRDLVQDAAACTDVPGSVA